jgi:hypothetical protein
MSDIQTKLNFTNSKQSLMTYYMYQRISGLNETTTNKLMIGMNSTGLMSSAGLG